MSKHILLQFVPLTSSGKLPVYHCFPQGELRVLENPDAGIVVYCGEYESPDKAKEDVLGEIDQKEWSSDMGKFIVHKGDGEQQVVHQ